MEGEVMTPNAFRNFALMFAFAIILFGCQQDKTPLGSENSDQLFPTLPVKPVQQKLIDANQKFGFELFKRINQISPDTNVFISPFSVSMALGMTMNGANGETYAAMRKTLGFENLDEQSINESYRYLYRALQALDPLVVFEIANSIWYKEGFKVLDEFLKVNRDYFSAEVEGLNFSDPSAVLRINSWVSEKTHEKIKKILDAIPSDAVMYLINAIYFNGTWKYTFPEEEVKQRDFFTLDGSKTDCQMMYVTSFFPVYFGEQLSAVELPYGAGSYVMTLILPTDQNSFEDFVNNFDETVWEEIQTNLSADSGTVGLPKFRFSFDQGLKPVLSDMGMAIAFDGSQADFTRINPKGNLFISKVKHKTFVEVNEKGTEAAAVTLVEMAITSVEAPKIFFLTFNRPFLFVIHEKSTGAVLFMGKIIRPIWEEE